MASCYAIDDSKWAEVIFINGYAVFMGYLMMGVRGLSVLIVTWTTVVLLGGFVSNLEKKDFWCLTGITLVQTAGVFNFLFNEKLSDMVHSGWGLLATIAAVVKDDINEELRGKNMVKAVVLVVIHGLVFGIILCPLWVLYQLGMYISVGVSLWRLTQHDFGNTSGTNQKPALQVLYSLAVAQGILFGYKTIHTLGARNRLMIFMSQQLGTVDKELVAAYLEETIGGCQKNPSFATGRNLITYGVDLIMEGDSNEGFIAGVRVISGAIQDYPWMRRSRKVLAKHLLTRSDSWSHMMQRLLETLGPRSPYSREVREHAARIFALVARGIRLEQFPAVIECISSMLGNGTPEESNNQQKGDSCFDRLRRKYGDTKLQYYERIELLEKYELDYLLYDRVREERRKEITAHNGLDDDGLLMEAVNIIHQLAVDEGNRRILRNCVSSTMLQRIAMLPLKLHRENHDVSRHESQESELEMLEKCWVLTEWLVSASNEETNSPHLQTAATSLGAGGVRIEEDEVQEEGEQERLLGSRDGSALRNAIIYTINKTIKSIFDCLDCGADSKKQGIQILLHLSLDMSFILDSESSTRRLAWTLLLTFYFFIDDFEYWMVSGFTYQDKGMPDDFCSIRRLAGEKLWEMLREKHDLPSEESARNLQLIRLTLADLTRAFADNAEDIPTRTHATIILEGLCFYYFTVSDSAKEVEGSLVGVIPNVVVKETLIHCAPTKERQAQANDVEEGSVSQDDVLSSYTDNKPLRKALVSLCRRGYMVDCSLKPKFEEIASKICKEQGKSFRYFKSLLV